MDARGGKYGMLAFSATLTNRPGTSLVFLAGLLWLSASCGPVGARHVKPGQLDASDDGGSGGESDTGGTGGGGTGGSTGGTGGGGTGGSGTGVSTGGSGGGGTGGSTGGTGGGGTGGRDASVPPDLAPDVGVDAPPDAPQTCVTGMPSVFMNTPMASQTGKFTAHFSVTATASPTNAIVAFSLGAQTGFAGYAAAARLNPMGMLDAVNAGNYDSVASIPYAANTTYQFRLAVDVAAHTYSVYVTPPGGSEATIGTGYAFRTGQTNVASLNSWGVVMQMAAAGTIKVCGFAIE
jgi:hypothetical protein